MVLLQRKLYFSKDQEGVQHFQGRSNFFQGVQMLISIETHITCDFPGGVRKMGYLCTIRTTVLSFTGV